MRCQHCGQQVNDYDEHLPKCPGVRAAFDDTYWPGWLDVPKLSVATLREHANERERRYRATGRYRAAHRKGESDV